MKTDKLKSRIAEISGSTMAAKLRQVMPEIDAKVRQGVRHEEIVAALADEGIEVKLDTLRKYLYRYRAQLREAGGSPVPPTPAKDANGNSPVVEDEADDTQGQPDDERFNDAIDARKRDQIGGQYTNRKRPLFGNKPKRSDD